MDRPPFKIKPPLLRITQLFIAVGALCGILIVGYSFYSFNQQLDYREELRCRNVALIEVNQANSVALGAILRGLANLDDEEKLNSIKNDIPGILDRMNRAVQIQEDALLDCGDN